MKKLNAFRWWLFIVYLSVKWMWRINLGDVVWYRGKQYMVRNGVRLNSWQLDTLDNGDDGWVLRHDCRKVCTISNAIHSFGSGYRFYMNSWYSIWTQRGIQPWMRACNIW